MPLLDTLIDSKLVWYLFGKNEDCVSYTVLLRDVSPLGKNLILKCHILKRESFVNVGSTGFRVPLLGQAHLFKITVLSSWRE